MTTTRPVYIYALIDPMDGLVRYIGRAFKPEFRFKQHLQPAATAKSTHKACWIRSLISAGLRPTLTIIEIIESEKLWAAAEKKWIAHYRLANSDKALTNGSDGGEGVPGYVRTPEWRQKQSAARKGKKRSSIATAKISEQLRGRKKSEEFCLNLSNKLKGRVRTPEHCRNISAAKKGKKLKPETVAKIAAASTGRKHPPRTEAFKLAQSLRKIAQAEAEGVRCGPRVCLGCSTEFVPKHSANKGKYCSHRCYISHRAEMHKAKVATITST